MKSPLKILATVIALMLFQDRFSILSFAPIKKGGGTNRHIKIQKNVPIEIGTPLVDENTDVYSILVAVTISGGGVRGLAEVE